MNFDITHNTIYRVLVIVLITASACSQPPEKSNIHSDKYKEAVSDFYLALSAIQSDQALFAVKKMKQVADA